MAPAETRTLSAASQPDLIGAGRIASADDDAVEALGIGVAGRLAQLGAALAHALLQHHEILVLARVAGERLDLEVHDLADVHDDVRILPLHDVDLAHLVGLELRHQLGEREMVARERVHAIQRDAADDTVVAVRGAELVGAQGVLADEEVGAVAPDLAGDVAAQPARVLDLAVRVAEERHLLDAERPRGVALLLLTDAGDGAAGLADGHSHRGRAAALVVRGTRRAAHRRRRPPPVARASMTAARALAAWPGPALVAGIIAAVAAGAPAAPVLVLAFAVTPLLALLQPWRAAAPSHPATLLITAGVAALLLWAHLAVLADAAALLGARRWQASVLAAALALLVTLAPGAGRRRGGMLAAGGAALLLVLVVVGVAGEVAPWTARSQAAARPALVFSGRSGWVTEGERFVWGTTPAFGEAHRVGGGPPGTFRVVEQDGGRRVVRDWRLAAGDAISLRPGDTLTASVGSRLRFEPGKRVPGAAPSGAAWADAAARVPAARALGLLATFALGACAVVPAGGRRVGVAPAIALALSLGATSWGVYATLAAPEAGLAGSPAEALLSLPRAVAPSRALPAGALAAVVLLGLLALFVAAADALRERISGAGGARLPIIWPAVMAAAALTAAVAVVDPWTPLTAGLGLAGAAIAAPRLAAGNGARRVLGWPLEVIGALFGAAVYAGLTLLSALLPAALAPLGATPVLAAAPAAWTVVRLLRTTRR